MIVDIGLILKSYLAPLPFVDRLGGIVRPITKTDRDGEKTIKKTFPVDCNVTEHDCIAGQYTDLVPNSKYKSIHYFEDNGTSILQRTAMDFHFQAKLKLVGWLNLKKLGKTECSLSSLAIANILKAFPTNYFNNGIYSRIQISVLGQDPKDSRIFSKYSYSEEQTQYLMYPYDYFALNLSVGFSIREACINDWNITPVITC
jgi:hypothetical protein